MMYDRPLFQIRERSFLDRLDLTFLVVRSRPLPLALAALGGIAPCAGLNYWLLSPDDSPPYLALFLLVMEVPWATAPLTVVLGDLMFGLPLSRRRIGAALLSGLPSLLLTQFLIRGILVVTVVGYLLVPCRYGFLDEVILLEKLRGLRAFGRAGSLCRGLEGECFLSWAAQLALGSAFVLCFWMGGDTIISALFGDSFSWARPRLLGLAAILVEAAVWMAVAFFGVFRFLSYIDRRIRLEGWELELRLKAAGRNLEQSAA
jgi:hypothetical protein